MNNRAFALLALILSAFIYFVYIQPLWGVDIATTKTAIESNKQALEAANKYKDRQRELIAARDAIDPESLAKLTTLLPNAVGNVGVILDLQALAQDSGFQLSNVDVAAGSLGSAKRAGSDVFSEDEINPVNSIDLSLSATGTYGAFQKFLAGIEKSQRLIDVQSLSITAAKTGTYSYQMALRIYWLR